MRYLIAFLLLILSVPLYAVQLEGLYSASVLVKDQSQAVRNAAMTDVLKKVIQKVSGRRQALDNPSLQAALSNVGSYVEQFQYKTLDEEPLPYRLTISFQKSALDNILTQFSVPIWGKNRPEILLWLAVDNGSSRQILSDETMAESVLLVARDAGLAVTLPLLDLDDQRAISFNDVWAGFSDQVKVASKRYSVNHVIQGRLLQVSTNHWQLSGKLLNGVKTYSLSVQQGSELDVLQSFLAEAAEHLAEEYAPHGVGELRQVKLQVAGVEGLSKLAEVTDYLFSLDRVKSVAWEKIQGRGIALLLTVSGEIAVLQDVIALNTVLLLAEPPVRYQPPMQQKIVMQDMELNQTVPMDDVSSLVLETLYYRVN